MTTRIRLTPMAGRLFAGLGLITLILSLFVLPALSAIIGAISGFLVGIFFGTPILKVLSAFGVSDVAMWEFGCFLGFVSGFFSSKFKNKTTR